MTKTCVALAFFFACGLAFAHEEPFWIATWASSPTGAPNAAKMGPFPLPPQTTLKGTLRYRLRISQGGSQFRLRFSNEYGDKPLTLNAVTVGLATAGLDAAPGSIKRVTFGDKEAVTMPAGAPALSDPVDLSAAPLADLVVSVYVLDGVPVTFCPPSIPTAEQAALENSNATTDAHWAAAKCTFFTRPIISEVDTLASVRSKVVVALGDSITDGSVDMKSGDRGWPGVLSRRLQGKDFSVVNAGIAGNRLLQSIPMLGSATLARLDRDALNVPGVRCIVLLEGINDIGASGPGSMFGDSPLADPQELIAAYSQVIARAHARGIKVIGATILPFEGSMIYTPEKEPIRSAVNEWIRSTKRFDGMVDFDAAVRDSMDPKKLNVSYDSGDHLHPNAEGYRRMGEFINLKLFD